MFRDIKHPLAVILILYAICGTLDFADQVAREQEASAIVVAAATTE